MAIESGILLEETIELPVKVADLEIDKDYILGIRSEHIEVCLEEEHLEATLQKVEYLGSETILYLQYKNCSFIAKSYSDTLYKIGDLIKIRFNLTKAHYFDGETRENIRRN